MVANTVRDLQKADSTGTTSVLIEWGLLRIISEREIISLATPTQTKTNSLCVRPCPRRRQLHVGKSTSNRRERETSRSHYGD